MTRSFTRIIIGLIALVTVAGVMLICSPAMTVSAAETPVFSLESTTASAKTGDIVTVSLYVTNETSTSVATFNGTITFNSSHFQYIDFSCPEGIANKLTCVDADANSFSKIGITYVDTTKSLIPSGASRVLLLQLRFRVVSSIAGTGQVLCSIEDCYNGMNSYGTISPAQLALPVEPTQSTTTSTTTSSTTTTTTTTKQRSSDALLRSLSVAPGVLTPAFNPEFVAYSVSVEFEVATIRISATPNSNAAVASGIGVKDLAVGANTFTVTVTAEDGSTMHYGIVVYRATDTPTTTSSEITTTSSSTSYIGGDLSTILGYPSTTTEAPLPTTLPQPDKVIEGGNDTPSDTDLIKIIGIIFAEVALFMFGFLAGFFLDKNMRKKSIAEMRYGPLDRQPPPRREPYPAEYPDYPDYSSDYQPEYPVYPDYQPQPEYTEEYREYEQPFQQYGGYDEPMQPPPPRFDEYGNPILDSAPYGDGYWDYNNNDPFYQ